MLVECFFVVFFSVFSEVSVSVILFAHLKSSSGISYAACSTDIYFGM